MYTDTTRAELLRAVGLFLTITGGVALFFLGGQLLAGEASGLTLINVAVLAVGVALLVTARARLARLWEANRPYLLSENGVKVLRGRREAQRRLLMWARVLLATFLVFGAVFFFLFSAIACGDRVDGFCGQVGLPPEALVQTWQLVTIAIGAAWAGLVSMRRRHESETEHIDVVIAEGQRRRRHDHPMAGTDRSAWE